MQNKDHLAGCLDRYRRTYLIWALSALLLLAGAGCASQASPFIPQQLPTATAIPAHTPVPTVTLTPLPTMPKPEEKGERTVAEQEAINLAKSVLAEMLDISLDEIVVQEVTAVDWPDSSLGCPQPGMMYAQVITPGFKVVLEAGEKTYEYHTDSGNVAVLCH